MLYASKILAQLVYPLTLCLVLVPLGLLLRKILPKIGTTLAAFGFLWLLVWSLPMPSFWLRSGLEQQYFESPAEDFPTADAIVVLGGGMEGAREYWRGSPDLNSAADRVWFGARLYHAGRAPRIILSGGTARWSKSPVPEAQAMAELCEALGVPREALILEERSRTTWENAAETRSILQAHGFGRVLLVTSALHMPRAVETFTRFGIEVIPAATDFEAVPPLEQGLLQWLPDTEALDGSTRAIKEYLGWLAYSFRDAPRDSKEVSPPRAHSLIDPALDRGTRGEAR